MVAEYIEKIQELAGRFRDNERNLTLYFPDLQTAPAADSYNRVFGAPVGLTDEHWPTFPELGELLSQADCVQHWDHRDTRMEHVFTVDLRGIKLLGAPEDAEAMMLFISNASFHRACADGNRHTQVVFLRREDLDRGLYQGALPERSLYRWSRRFSLVPVDVPGEVFEVPQLDLLPDDLLVELYDAIADAPARLGGLPTGVERTDGAPGGWDESSPTLPRDNPPVVQAGGFQSLLEAPAHANSRPTVPDGSTQFESRRTIVHGDSLLERSYTDGDPANARTFGHRVPRSAPSSPFLMQFHRRFADVNLGPEGVMYVSGRSAYVQPPAA
ncbi:MAG: hypothetical protein AAF799_11860 [Myxococcota bacterium]